MTTEQRLLQISAKLYQQLESVPKSENRAELIQDINRLLDERGEMLELILQEGFQIDPQNKIHSMLIELDKGIRERLSTIMNIVKSDMRNLQTAKKNERQYINPYSSVRAMDGRYYDKKK